MMFYKVITISLITICAAERRMLSSRVLSEQELVTPSQPFKRHAFLPMILKFAKYDEHITANSKPRSARYAHANNMFEELQYAPLHDGLRDYTNPLPTHSSAPVEPTEMVRSKKLRKSKKSHLEPRTDAPDNNLKAPSASRSPGHNAVYRKIPEPILKEEPVPVHKYEKPIGINLHFEKATSTSALPLVALSSDIKHKPLTLTKDHYVLTPNSLETDLPVQDKSKRYSSHPKYHRLHLNIARVYSPGQVPPKAPAYARAYPENFGIPPKPQANIPQPYQDQSKNTMLFPVKHNRKGNYRPRTSILHF